MNQEDKIREKGVSDMTAAEGHREEGSIWRLVAAPFMGLLYAIALPFIGIATVATLIIERVVRKVATLASFGWRPVEAYLGGKKISKKRKEG